MKEHSDDKNKRSSLGDRLQPFPWFLSDEDKSHVRDAIMHFRMPIERMHSLSDVFTGKNELNGLKTHDWHKMLAFILPVCMSPFDVHHGGHMVSTMSSMDNMEAM